MSLLKDKIVTARKSHRCELCGEEIKPGEKYRYQSYADRFADCGPFWTLKLHTQCAWVWGECSYEFQPMCDDSDSPTADDVDNYVRDTLRDLGIEPDKNIRKNILTFCETYD